MKKDRFSLILVSISALLISASAAFFSVYGLSKVFAGASLAVVIMASVLEASKLITAFVLHQKKDVLPPFLRTYLSIAVIVLMIITSAGIYGFLSNAYQLTSNENTILQQEVSIVEARIENLENRLEDAQSERESIVKDITELRNGLSSGTVISYIDKESGERITTTSSATRKSLEAQLNDATERRNDVSEIVEELSTEIDSLKIEVLTLESNNDAAAELGPIIYLSKVTEVSMDVLINYFILMIIFVFDPLAICLVIAASYLSKVNRKQIIDSPVKDIAPSSSETEEELTKAFSDAVSKRTTTKKPVKKVSTIKKRSNVSSKRTVEGKKKMN